jgi:hypothetical protein
MRSEGFTKMDAFTPFPVHGLDHALGLGRSRLGYVVFGAGFVGMVLALLLQWWTGAVDYPLVIGGKPLFAFEFSIPITFEVTVLLAAFAAVLGMLAVNGLPRLHHPIFDCEASGASPTTVIFWSSRALTEIRSGLPKARVKAGAHGSGREEVA